MSLKDFLKDTLDIGRDAIYKVDTKDSFSFFNTDAEHTEKILSTFSEFKVDGRFVNVEVSKNPGGSGGGGRRRDRDRGGRDQSRNSGSGGRRRDRSSFKSNSGNSGSSSGKRRSKKRDGFY